MNVVRRRRPDTELASVEADLKAIGHIMSALSTSGNAIDEGCILWLADQLHVVVDCVTSVREWLQEGSAA